MHVILFRSGGWPSRDVEFEPLVREGMPVLVDDDLLFEDAPGCPRPAVVVNQWLRELPTSGAPSPNTWQAYARALRDWLVFLGERGLGAFEQRDRLRSGLSLYAEYRLSGPLPVRLAENSWDLHTTVLARFYDWGVAEGHAPATPAALLRAWPSSPPSISMRVENCCRSEGSLSASAVERDRTSSASA